jgi:RNA polymerase sigma factor (TIGR02999 family)
VVYAQLHRLARRNLAGAREGRLLQPSALVNESFLRLLGNAPAEWANRSHFFAYSARLMRQISIDFARRGCRQARPPQPHVSLSGIRGLAGGAADPRDFIDLDAASDELARLNPRHAQVVGLQYFGGLEDSEIATILGVSERTLIRD